jgi:hypothetical protein
VFLQERSALGVSSTIDEFEELFVLKAIDHAEKAVVRACRQEGAGTIVGCHARCEAFPGCRRRLAVQAHPSSQEETDVHERAYSRWSREKTMVRGSQKLVQCYARSRSGQIDGPCVVKGDSFEKGMDSERLTLEFLRRDLWHFNSLRIIDCPADVYGSTSKVLKNSLAALWQVTQSVTGPAMGSASK